MKSLPIWITISSIFFISIKKEIDCKNLNPYTLKQEEQKIKWKITIITLLFIYITDKNIENNEERLLINSIIVFSATLSYLYFLYKKNSP